MTQILCLALLAQDTVLVREYERKLGSLGPRDVEDHFKLGQWCLKNGLRDLAEARFEAVLAESPDHAGAREGLGYVKEGGGWKETPARQLRKRCLEAVKTGFKPPSAEELDALRAKSKLHKKGVEFFAYPETWVQALCTMQEQTGLFDGSLDLRLSFGELGPDKIGEGSGVAGKGQVKIDLEKVVTYYKQVDDLEKKKRQGFIVEMPPMPLAALACHELTHVFQDHKGDPWVVEGMACYATGSPYYYWWFKHLKGRVRAIDKTPTDKFEHYGRGMAFFAWVESKGGREKAREFIRLLVKEKAEPAQAVEKVLGQPWDEAVRQERSWSDKFISRQEPK
jgi:hypothetical protein